MDEFEQDSHELTPKQEAFCQEYLKDLNATQAAIRAGYSLDAHPTGYYVYLLCDPRTGEVFYVGKGKGRRMLSHDRGRLSALDQNPRKCAKIREIREAGKRTSAYVFKAGLDESSAFSIERALIKTIGRERLTNHSSGVVTIHEHAKLLLSQIKPFNLWVSENSGRAKQAEMYWMVKSSLEILVSRVDAAGVVFDGSKPYTETA